jgi:hypothetical protein
MVGVIREVNTANVMYLSRGEIDVASGNLWSLQTTRLLTRSNPYS